MGEKHTFSTVSMKKLSISFGPFMQMPSYSICFDLQSAAIVVLSGDNNGKVHWPGGKFVNKLIVSLK